MTEIGRLRFLVVEDQGFQRWVAANVLAGLGAKHVICASDGREALDFLARADPAIDIVVSDLDMPEMDGMELIRHMGQTGRPISLILMSALERSLVASVEQMARAYGVNLLGAIEKPATAKKLAALIALHAGAPAASANESLSNEPITDEEIAAALRDGAFEAFFQPKVVLRTGHVKGAEAIARWRHPVRGLIAPDAFVARLEAAGLIQTLTDRILDSAAFYCRQWRKAGFDTTVSVNLSLLSLAEATLAERMLELVRGHGIVPRDVIFEVTESAAASDPGMALENLSRLRMRGFGLSIDDYGTGYSSMQRLSRIPFTELKIDQSFVENAVTQPASRAVVESSLEMAQKLGIVAVAEGVETRAQWDLLLALGCPVAQGFFVAKPMDGGEFLDWMRQRRSGTA
jgi:EAL domain-containing protein (putative c-di-GMP-specific phosphodiesterase class I)/FixJ family two-component response regulator